MNARIEGEPGSVTSRTRVERTSDREVHIRASCGPMRKVARAGRSPR